MQRDRMPWMFALASWLLTAGCIPDEQIAVSEPASPVIEGRGVLQAGDLSNAAALTYSATPAGADSVHAAALWAGDFDPTFAGGGMVFHSLSAYTRIGYSLLTQPDGQIIVSGTSGYVADGPAGCKAFLGRFNQNGSIDTTFAGGSGLRILQISTLPSSNCYMAKAVLQADGKIVVVTKRALDWGSDLLLLRFTANGSLDNTFGTGGVVTYYNYSLELRDVAVTSTGQIVLAGRSPNDSGDFFIERYSSAGVLLSHTDYGFLAGSTDILHGIRIQPDGKILAIGQVLMPGMASDIALARFNASGSVDTAFGFGGGLMIDVFGYNDMPGDVAVQGDGRILVGVGASYPPNNTTYLSLFRLNATGTAFDTTFAGTGQSYVSFGTGSSGVSGLALQSDGKILMGGVYNSNPALLRFTSSGALDNTFLGGGGFWFNASSNNVSGIALQPDGKIILGGISMDSSIRLSRHLK